MPIPSLVTAKAMNSHEAWLIERSREQYAAEQQRQMEEIRKNWEGRLLAAAVMPTHTDCQDISTMNPLTKATNKRKVLLLCS